MSIGKEILGIVEAFVINEFSKGHALLTTRMKVNVAIENPSKPYEDLVIENDLFQMCMETINGVPDIQNKVVSGLKEVIQRIENGEMDADTIEICRRREVVKTIGELAKKANSEWNKYDRIQRKIQSTLRKIDFRKSLDFIMIAENTGKAWPTKTVVQAKKLALVLIRKQIQINKIMNKILLILRKENIPQYTFLSLYMYNGRKYDNSSADNNMCSDVQRILGRVKRRYPDHTERSGKYTHEWGISWMAGSNRKNYEMLPKLKHRRMIREKIKSRKNKKAKPPEYIEANKDELYPGKRIAKLVIIKKDEDPKYKKWKCKCDCGKERSINYYSLLSGATLSCGCLRREMIGLSGQEKKAKAKLNKVQTDICTKFNIPWDEAGKRIAEITSKKLKDML